MASLRQSARSMLRRVGREEQARALAGHLRVAFDPIRRRELTDEHAVRAILTAVLHPDSSAIDVGANVGAVLEMVTRLAPDGHHIAFEPIPGLHERLVARFPNVDVRRTALSDTAGTDDFAHVLGAEAFSGLRERSDLPVEVSDVQQIVVRTERLDDVLPEDYAPTLLKIDVEGAELQVLRGAIETLERHRPVVLFEHGAGGADLYGTRPHQVFDLLEGAMFRIFDLDGTGPYSREQWEHTFTEPIWNFIATPI